MTTLPGLMLVALLCGSAAPVEEPRAVCLRTASGQETGRLVRIADGRFVLRAEAGEQSHELRDFREILFPERETSPVRPPLRLYTRAGGLLMARELRAGEEPETVDVTGYGWHAQGMPLEQVAAVATRGFLMDATPAQLDRLRQTRLDPPVGQDRLLMRGQREATGCIVAGFGSAGPVVLRGEEQTTPLWEEVAWLVLSPVGPADAGDAPRHTVALVHGSRLRVDSLELAEGRLEAMVEPTRYVVERERLQWIRLAPVGYCYLSDLQPAQTATEPWLDVVWPPRVDAAVTGATMRLAGETYSKGIGTYPRTTLTWRLEQPYAAFHAMVGVDEAAGRRGSVVFRVLLDGREVWAAGPLSGANPPQEAIVPLNGAAELTLVTDFGEPLAAGEAGFADWAGARVVR